MASSLQDLDNLGNLGQRAFVDIWLGLHDCQTKLMMVCWTGCFGVLTGAAKP
jgi:hypothetical protein